MGPPLELDSTLGLLLDLLFLRLLSISIPIKITPFTIVTNNIKYLGVILTKQVNNLYENNFKFLKKEIVDLRK